MSKIDELIREYCPDGVLFKPVESIAELKRGTSITKKSIKEGGIPVIAGGQKPAYYHNQSNRTGETIVVAGSGAYAGFVTFWTIPIFVSDAFTVIPDPEVVSPKYLFYFLKSKQSALHDMQRGGGVPHVYTKDVAPMRIPIPPLAVQKEIVNILDKFTQLEAELSAELDARRKQYEYYRKQLLTFDESVVPFSDLGDVYKFQYGKGNTIPTAGGDYPVYGSNGVVGSHHEYNSEDAPVIGHIGAYAGIVNWGEGKHFVTYNGVICQIKSGIDDRFGYHLLMKQNLRELARDGSQPFVSYDKLNSVKVQIPDIDTQKQIAKILDGFDLLTNGITEGLPAEINARRQQYEYYRTKLLTFQELAA